VPFTAVSRRRSGWRAMSSTTSFRLAGLSSTQSRGRSRAPCGTCGGACAAASPPSRLDGAVHADCPPQQFDEALGHHEADARAFLAPGLLSETIERLEQLRQ